MKLTATQYAQALYLAAAETATKDHETILERFIKILQSNGDLGKFPEIELEFKKFEAEKKGLKQGLAKLAKDHDGKILNELNQIVRDKTEFKIKIEEELVGGVVLKVDETLIDASIKTQLKNLNSELKS